MIELLTIAYGEHHLELFRKTALKSLAQLKNKRCFYDENTRWNICTDDKHFDHVRRTVDIYFPELEVNLISRSDLRRYIDPIQAATIWQIEESIRNKSKVILAPPDTIYSDGTIKSMLDKASEGTCVAVAHPRTLPSILEHEFIGLSNPDLVSLAWKHLHQSWSHAEMGCDGYNFRAGGVQWEYINSEQIRGIHMLPSPYLLQFTSEDLDFFKHQISFGSFDHIWSAQMLIPQGRRKYMNSSEDGFIIEITDQHKNVPPLFPGDQEKFWREDTPNELTAAQLEVNKRIPFYFTRSK